MKSARKQGRRATGYVTALLLLAAAAPPAAQGIAVSNSQKSAVLDYLQAAGAHPELTASLGMREMLLATLRIVRTLDPKYEYDGQRAVDDLACPSTISPSSASSARGTSPSSA